MAKITIEVTIETSLAHDDDITRSFLASVNDVPPNLAITHSVVQIGLEGAVRMLNVMMERNTPLLPGYVASVLMGSDTNPEATTKVSFTMPSHDFVAEHASTQTRQ